MAHSSLSCHTASGGMQEGSRTSGVRVLRRNPLFESRSGLSRTSNATGAAFAAQWIYLNMIFRLGKRKSACQPRKGRSRQLMSFISQCNLRFVPYGKGKMNARNIKEYIITLVIFFSHHRRHPAIPDHSACMTFLARGCF